MKLLGISSAIFAVAMGPRLASAEDAEDLHEDKIHKLSREESDIRMGRLFHLIDANKDNIVDSAELEEFNKVNVQRIHDLQLDHEMQMIDDDKNGFIDLQELQQSFPPDSGSYESFSDGLSRRFDVADKDKDGKLSKEELHCLLNPGMDDEMLRLEVQDIMRAHDKNGDGLISIAEYVSTKTDNEDVGELLESGFKPFDLNGDGMLSEAEIVAAFLEEAKDELESNIEDVYAIVGEGPIDYDTWMKHSFELSTSSITDHGEILRYPGDYQINLDEDVGTTEEKETSGTYAGDEL